MTGSLRLIGCVAGFLLLPAGAAHADAIDGDWCAADGQQMSIQGPAITTPGGSKLQGSYSRHAFDYVVPAGEKGAGEAVSILLRGEYLAVSRQGPSDAPLKEWRRCKATTS